MRNSYVDSRSPIRRDILFILFLLWWGARTCDVSGWPEIVAMSKYVYAKVMIDLIRLYMLMIPFNLPLYFMKKESFSNGSKSKLCLYLLQNQFECMCHERNIHGLISTAHINDM